ncbi:MAG: chemotaxis protein CheA [Oscillospiraceae bacterium]|nr:chemotaxis protein CheA [Oscillospiraceae bacterium]
MKDKDPMLEIFIFESQQLLETLEETLLEGEKEHCLNDEQINEIFRIMHTIKGSASMMSYENIAGLAHAVEDLFSQIREKKARSGDWNNIFEIVLESADLLKDGIDKVQLGKAPDAGYSHLIDKIHHYLELVSHRKPKPDSEGDDQGAGGDEEADDYDTGEPAAFYKIKVTFAPNSQMESMRAFGIVTALTPHCRKKAHIPEDLMIAASNEEIEKNGFVIYIQSTENPDNLKKIVEETMFLDTSSIIHLPDDSDAIPESMRAKPETRKDAADAQQAKPTVDSGAKQNFISVNVNKLDKLMDLVGEIVTTESMVTKNPEVAELHIEGFENNSKHLEKLIHELQEIVMSVRMIPVSTTFHKMNRLVRDMSKKVTKQVNLNIVGEETEVDKNIIDSLSDPLMHLIRNAVDHGIETPEERREKGKNPAGTLILEARNTGGDVIIIVSDDGRGLDRNAIIKKATEAGLTTKSESEISDREAFSFVFLPGFSTNKEVTEYSGRGVGMDVVRRNIEKVGGTINLESYPDKGTTFLLRIPLTLAIMEGMKLSVGDLIFVVPMLSIQESFKPDMKDVFFDPDGREMIMIRGECYPIVRLYELFDLKPKYSELSDGILVMLNSDTLTFCLFVDQLIGEQQAVIKPLPMYIKSHNLNMHGIGGCTILGDGSISLIIDINNLLTD